MPDASDDSSELLDASSGRLRKNYAEEFAIGEGKNVFLVGQDHRAIASSQATRCASARPSSLGPYLSIAILSRGYGRGAPAPTGRGSHCRSKPQPPDLFASFLRQGASSARFRQIGTRGLSQLLGRY
jgi:hypothetical protein